ncbi:MAG TPA: hypothetical protein VIK55_12480 [Paludibacter sp.]
MESENLNFIDLLDLERFIPVMSPVELSTYQDAVLGVKAAISCLEQVDRWTELLLNHDSCIQNRFNSVILKSKILK